MGWVGIVSNQNQSAMAIPLMVTSKISRSTLLLSSCLHPLHTLQRFHNYCEIKCSKSFHNEIVFYDIIHLVNVNSCLGMNYEIDGVT